MVFFFFFLPPQPFFFFSPHFFFSPPVPPPQKGKKNFPPPGLENLFFFPKVFSPRETFMWLKKKFLARPRMKRERDARRCFFGPPFPQNFQGPAQKPWGPLSFFINKIQKKLNKGEKKKLRFFFFLKTKNLGVGGERLKKMIKCPPRKKTLKKKFWGGGPPPQVTEKKGDGVFFF